MHWDGEETEEEEGVYNQISPVVITGGIKAVHPRAATLFSRVKSVEIYIQIWTNHQGLS